MSAASNRPEPTGPPAGGAPRSALLAGIVAVLLALVAALAIVSGGGTAAPERAIDAEERAIERAAARGSGSGGDVPRVGPSAGAPRALDAGIARAPEAGLAAEIAGEAPGTGAGGGEGASAARPPVDRRFPSGVTGPVTLDQEYRATAFFLDMLVLRRDTVRRELDEARRTGDGPRLRRLEPDLPALDAEIERFSLRATELEGRLRERDAAGAGADDGAAGTGAGDARGAATGLAPAPAGGL